MSENPDLVEVTAVLRAFVAEREWAQFHDPKNLAMCLASEAGEVLAELRWVAGHDADRACLEPGLRARLTAELGDVGIAWLLLCDRIGVDPMNAIAAKIERNRSKYPVEESRGRAESPEL